MPTHRATARPTVLLALLTVVTLATFCRLLTSDFSWYDDQQTIHHNPSFNPPGWHTIVEYWTRPHMGLYVPVTYTVWTAIAAIAFVGMPDEFNVSLNPWFFHGANVALHVGSTWLAFFLILRLLRAGTGRDAPVAAAFGAALFALHPLQVETLGWVSGMKDLLCWFGVLAATLIYVRRVQDVQQSGRPLWASAAMPMVAVVVALAILSKPSAVVAPAVMWAIDGFVLRRRWVKSAIELAPIFALSIAGVLVAREFQFVGMAQQVPLWQRPFVASDALTFYLTKFVAPFSLTIDYGRKPTLIVAQGWTYVRWLVPAGIAVAAWLRRRRDPLLPVAAAIVVIGIAPVSGLATFQMQAFSTTTDHYVYFAMVGLGVALAWAIARWPATWVRAIATIVLAAFAVRSFDQTAIWKDTFALFEHASRVRPDSVIAQNNRAGVALGKLRPDYETAKKHVLLALALDPENYYALQTYGVVLAHEGKADEAAAAFDKLWALCLHYNTAPVYRLEVAQTAYNGMMSVGRFADAIAWAERMVEVDPGGALSQGALGSARSMLATQRAATRPVTTTTAAPTPAPASAPSR